MTFDLQPTLRGALLELRPLRPEDWGPLFAVASDPQIWEQHPDRERYKEEVFGGFFRTAIESRAAFVAVDSKDGRIIGSSRYHGHDERQSVIAVRRTAPPSAGRGRTTDGDHPPTAYQRATVGGDSAVMISGWVRFRPDLAVRAPNW